ncbi:MAG: RNA polymerase sigma factor [Alphaproteobacteria bacterium]|nr:RNA polymerase sigma factor [Alphaproteobacteria bacterium]
MNALRVLSGNALPEDEEIKVIARKDRRAAADLVVRKYRDRLFHHACYVLKDYQEATDVTQEVFIKAMREKRFFEDDFKMKAWLFRVTSNLCFNIRRDKKRRTAILETVPRATFTAADQVDLVFSNEKQEHILSAMDALTENHRQILMLRYYDDLSYAEIAQVLDVALGTVMSRLSRAKGQLMEVMDDLRVVEE